MTSDSIVNVTEAQARLNKLIDQDSFAISRHGKVVGVYLSRDRIEALVESMELFEHASVQSDFGGIRIRAHEVRRRRFSGQAHV